MSQRELGALTMKPLAGRCRACDARVELREIVTRGDGRCPACSTPFSEDWTLLLVEECDALEHLTEALVRSLRRLTGLPGNLELQPDELFANLSGEVPWGQSIDTEPAKVAAEIGRLAQRLDRHPTGPSAAFTDDIRTLATNLLALATVLEANQEAVDPTRVGAGAAARSAAHNLTEAADALDDGNPDLDALREGLRAAANAT